MSVKLVSILHRCLIALALLLSLFFTLLLEAHCLMLVRVSRSFALPPQLPFHASIIGRLMTLTSTVLPNDRAANEYHSAVAAIANSNTSATTAATVTSPSKSSTSSVSPIESKSAAITPVTPVTSMTIAETLSGTWLLIDEQLSPYDAHGEKSSDRIRDITRVWASPHNVHSTGKYRFGSHNTIIIDGNMTKSRHMLSNVVELPRWHRDVMNAAAMAADRSLPGIYLPSTCVTIHVLDVIIALWEEIDTLLATKSSSPSFDVREWVTARNGRLASLRAAASEETKAAIAKQRALQAARAAKQEVPNSSTLVHVIVLRMHGRVVHM
jgi:hypothetical protein